MLASLQVCFKVAWFCFSGHYMFIETSAPRIRGDNALLLSPQHPASSGDVCVTFYYHMHGSTIGTLNLRVGRAPVPVVRFHPTPTPFHPPNLGTRWAVCMEWYLFSVPLFLSLNPHPPPPTTNPILPPSPFLYTLRRKKNTIILDLSEVHWKDSQCTRILSRE